MACRIGKICPSLFCMQLALGCGIDPFSDAPAVGNPDGNCPVPIEAQAEDVSKPDRVVGTGTPDSCTGDAFLDAVSTGGIITFDCGPAPVTITLDRTANPQSYLNSKLVIDGGGKVALSGGGKVRILYMNNCDLLQPLSASNCQEAVPQIALQNLTFVEGNTNGQDIDGGGAVFLSGGQIKVVNSRFFRNICDDGDGEGGGGALRVINQYPDQRIYLVQSTFGGGDRFGNTGINGGAISSVNASYIAINSVLSFNYANGPAGAGGGGAIDTHDAQALSLCGVQMNDNRASGAGGAIWFDSNNDHAVLSLNNSTLENNQNAAESAGYPGIRFSGTVVVNSSTIK